MFLHNKPNDGKVFGSQFYTLAQEELRMTCRFKFKGCRQVARFEVYLPTFDSKGVHPTTVLGCIICSEVAEDWGAVKYPLDEPPVESIAKGIIEAGGMSLE